MERVKVMDYDVSRSTTTDIANHIESLTHQDVFSCVVTLNPEMLVQAEENAELKAWFKRASLRVPDGIGLVLMAKMVFGQSLTRITGVSLVENLFQKACSFYFVGSKSDIIHQSVKNIKEQYPSINIKGFHHGYLDENKEMVVLEDIKQKKPGIILVGMGSPKQDLFLKKLSQEINCGVGIGVGGVFDVYAGAIKRAPKGFQKIGLEWAYRGLIEPSRMKRWVFLPKFLRLAWKGVY
jgi:N-acetylglucosaminyldiphosphoundecaprenol N-acetyl-beta-D-mannosaminyltransferase